MGHPDYDCQALELFPDEDKYAECKDLLKDVGFDYIEGFYYGNIKSNSYFSHNPEWMVNEAANFVGEAVARDEPFFMYFASTLTHSPDADVCDVDTRSLPLSLSLCLCRHSIRSKIWSFSYGVLHTASIGTIRCQ